MDEIYTMNSDGTGVARLTRNTRNEYDLDYSPDGNKIAFSALDENGPTGQQGGPDYDIYTINTDGTGVARLTDNTTMDLDPAYSPDGNKIAYSHYHGTNNNEIFTINANGGGTEQQITSNGAYNTDPAWQPLPTNPGTDTFINGDIIHVPAAQLSGETFGRADPYPSMINVSEAAGFKSVTDVNVTIRGARHTNPDDIDVLLVGPTGRTAILWSDAGGTNAISVPDLTFDDDAHVFLPDSGQITGAQSYMPSNYEVGVDDWPGVNQSDKRQLSTFDGTNPTGEWRLYVFDDTKQPNPGPGGGAGNSFANGWALEIRGTR